MSVDVQRLMDIIPFVNTLWSGLIQISVALYFLWGELGPSVLSGVGVMILLIPVNSFVASKVRNLQSAQMKNKDQRVEMMNEILSGVRVMFAKNVMRSNSDCTKLSCMLLGVEVVCMGAIFQ